MKKILLLALCVIITASVLGNEMQVSENIPDSKITTPEKASNVAFSGYSKKMKLDIKASEIVQSCKKIKVGYNVGKFAAKNTYIWEVRIGTLEGNLRGLIWVNPYTEKLSFLSGAWEEKTD